MELLDVYIKKEKLLQTDVIDEYIAVPLKLKIKWELVNFIYTKEIFDIFRLIYI